MRIQNNTPHRNPSFGTFLPPKDIDKFTKFVTEHRRAKAAAYGVKDIIDKQANNIHFNLSYNAEDNSFIVFAASADAKKFYSPEKQTKIFPVKGDYPKTDFEKFVEKLRNKDNYYKTHKVSGLRKFFHNIKSNIQYSLASFAANSLHPIDILPANFREASKCATRMSNSVERRVETRETISSFFPKVDKLDDVLDGENIIETSSLQN